MFKLWWTFLKVAFGPKKKPKPDWNFEPVEMDFTGANIENDYPTELFTIEEFREAVKQGLFNDYDGVGYYTNSAESHSETPVDLSALARGEEVKGYTHIEWFNK